MKLWLDDRRPGPPGWLAVQTAREAIALLKTGKVREASLDYDLSFTDRSGQTGFDVLEWMASEGCWQRDSVSCHSGQLDMRSRMERFVADNFRAP